MVSHEISVDINTHQAKRNPLSPGTEPQIWPKMHQTTNPVRNADPLCPRLPPSPVTAWQLPRYLQSHVLHPGQRLPQNTKGCDLLTATDLAPAG